MGNLKYNNKAMCKYLEVVQGFLSYPFYYLNKIIESSNKLLQQHTANSVRFEKCM